MAGPRDFNAAIVDEFRANAGKVGGQFASAPLLLLHHKGARTGTERVNPLAYQAVGDNLAVFASKGGAPTNPDWYYDLIANPETVVELGGETIPVVARIAGDEERQPIWEKQKRQFPGFADYERNSPRKIPVIILERADRR
jgi:deazaflavin-dependent oxidoreductase (nitroreductase family)